MEKEERQNRRLGIIKIVSIYAIFGLVWIYTSDSVLNWVVHDLETVRTISIFKGSAYVLLTSLLLYILIGRFDRKLAQSEKATRSSELFLRTILNTEPDCVKMLDPDGKLIMMNRAGLNLIEADTFEEVSGKRMAALVSGTDREAFEELGRQVFSGRPGNLEFHAVGLKGRSLWLSTHAVPYFDDKGEIVAVLGITREISESKRAEAERLGLERQMLHVQKLESLGVLAGGIAHDFNNILMAIIGNADLALMRVNKESPVVENLQRIEKAAAQAADLSRQMLAYSGKGRFVIEALDLNCLVEEMFHMLEVSISKKVVPRLNLHRPLPTIDGDASQLRQIIMNLVINASDAIGDRSGVIGVTTGCVDCDQNYLRNTWGADNLADGLYVFLEVADTGCGMDGATISRIFDPFFTTKFAGRGLGLAAVLGIVRGHGGAIRVYSEPKKGTTFKILLPAGARPKEIFCNSVNVVWQGGGKALLVDDEESVRAIGKDMLKELGFEVLLANDGVEALKIFKRNPDVGVVILDLTMPHMDGDECYRELRRIRPDVRVVISSGYNEQEVTQRFVGKGLAGFIQKPYKVSELRDVLRKLGTALPESPSKD